MPARSPISSLTPTVNLAIVRYGDKREVDMTLGSFPSAKKLASLRKEEPADQSPSKMEKLGLSLAPAAYDPRCR